MKRLKVLIGCEHSGVVRDSFLKAGHDAWSCDLLDDISGHPNHIKGNVLDILDRGWNLAIFHPPCTDLAVSGARYFAEKRADGRQQAAIDFFMKLANADIPLICIENPVSVMSTQWRKPDQIIQPWMFRHDASKRTCLWLKGLPKLEHGEIIPPEGWMLAENEFRWKLAPVRRKVDGYRFWNYGVLVRPLWANQTPSGQNKLGPSPDRWKKRAETYQGIADQMAAQWGKLV